ncbi:MAG: PEP-CTERM sorting domain-containing protein [Bryobacteraceae bacterium]
MGSTANITNSSFSCASLTAPCSGNVLSFAIQGIGSPFATPFSVNIDGTLSGITPALGTLNVTSPFNKTIPFSLSAGTFNTAIVSTSIPSDAMGNFSGAGTVGLSLAPGQTVTLPSSLSFTVGTPATSSVPEPGTAMLTGGALLGTLGFLKRRRGRA